MEFHGDEDFIDASLFEEELIQEMENAENWKYENLEVTLS